MGSDQRDYSRSGWDDGPGNRFFRGMVGGADGGDGWIMRLLRWLNSSIGFGTYLGIRVKLMRWSLVLYGILIAQGWIRDYWAGAVDNFQIVVLLFLSVLLHEFGHCLACRAVGGRAEEIVMWPLGGLAFCEPPRRVWPDFVTTMGGPLVNLVIAVGSFVAMGLLVETNPLSFNPFRPFLAWGLDVLEVTEPWVPLLQLLSFLFLVNWLLFCFNMLLPMYPMDAGRLMQAGIWWLTDYRTSLRWAYRVGMVLAVMVFLYGLFGGGWMLTMIAFFCGWYCFQQNQMLKHEEGTDEYAPWRESLEWRPEDDRPGGRSRGDGGGLIARWKEAAAERRRRLAEEVAEKRRAREAAYEAELDRVLEKVSREGMASLSPKERKTLEQETARRQREG